MASSKPPFLTLDDIDFSHKTVLVRLDLNLPFQDGQVTDATRIMRILPTLQELIGREAKIILLSHFGRPEGRAQEKYSLKKLLAILTQFLGQVPLFAPDCIGALTEEMAKTLAPGQILLLENLRFHEGEETSDPAFAKSLARLGDIYVNEAFSCSHRAHASIVGITHHLPAVAGRTLQTESETLATIMNQPRRPLMAIVAGSKVSTKLDLLHNLVQKADTLVVGGGMANTFLNASGFPVGRSLCESQMKETAKAILDKAEGCGCDIILPQDVAVTHDIKASADCRVVPIAEVAQDDIIVDIGEKTIATICDRMSQCTTLIWNGPVGIFEMPPYDRGTTHIAQAVAGYTAKGQLVSVAGGGDTLAALGHAGCSDALTYTSTAGGAFLEWLEGKTLAGIKALEENKNRYDFSC